MMTHIQIQPDQKTIELLAQADLLLLMAGFFAPERAKTNRECIVPEVTELLGAADFADDTALRAALEQLVTAAAETGSDQRLNEHHRLFEGSMPCPLTETAYIRRDKGAIIGDLCGFYRAFGWMPDAASGEKADHLATELQFMGLLLVMLAEARIEGDDAHHHVTADALRAFAEDHLGDWLPAVCAHLKSCTMLPLYETLADSTAAVWRAIAQRHSFAFTAPDLPAAFDDEATVLDDTCGGETKTGLTALTIGKS